MKKYINEYCPGGDDDPDEPKADDGGPGVDPNNPHGTPPGRHE